jgi:hypothetical protein
MIVKVQVALFSSEDRESVLIYDESRQEVFEHIGFSDYLKGLMGDDVKKFFYAEKDGARLNILEEAPWQEW